MTLTAVQFIIWLVIAAIVGFLGEFIAGRRAPAGFLGAIMVGLFAIFLIVGFFHFSIKGEPTLEGVPVISTIIAAVMVVVLWSSIAYRGSVFSRR
ncbi:MAG TPA: transglycosylase [Ktedonobacteraceae bacterium]|nr:transglycosylase [Ktedonobacteraceae bacterium]